MGGEREPEYALGEGRPILENGSDNIVAVSDGSVRQGKAAVAAGPVQNMRGSCTSRLSGTQRISKAEHP